MSKNSRNRFTLPTVISVKIPKRLREQLREKGVNVSLVVKQALEREIARRDEEELRLELDGLKKSLSRKISTRDVVRAVRSSRGER